MSTQVDNAFVLKGDLVDFTLDEGCATQPPSNRIQRRGALVVDNAGRIAWRGHAARLPQRFAELPVRDHADCVIMPGLIDVHVHFPQHRMLAAPGKDLLDWLQRFTFVEEAKYRTRTHASAAAQAFIDKLIEHGTTTAVAYSSVHKQATQALFEAAERRGFPMIAGKTMMDRNAPATVLDTPSSSARDSAALIDEWHGRGRARYAITVRFAITSTEAQLGVARELRQQYPACIFQTHLSESAEEIALVKQLFPWARDYTDVYDHYELLGPRSLFAHGIHLSAGELTRLHRTGSTVVHCPTSNNFLGSGLFDIDRCREPRRPVHVGIATDVGGGTSFSMLQTLGEAYKVAMLNARTLNATEAFFLATLGNARSLGMDHELGSLDVGKWADLVVLDPRATNVMAERHALSHSVDDTLFALMMLGDDRAVSETYVSGRALKSALRTRRANGRSAAATEKTE